MKKIKKSIIIFCVKYISELSIQSIYKLPRFIAGILLAIIVSSGISSLVIYFLTDSLIPMIISMFIILLCISFSTFYNYVTKLAVQCIYAVKTDVKKWLEYYEYSFKRIENDVRLLDFQLSSVVVSYYKGEFQNCFNIAGEMKLYQLREVEGKKDRVQGELLLTITLAKASAMLKNEQRFEKCYSSLCNQKVKTETQNEIRANYLTFCQIIKEIYLKNNPTDMLDEWQPDFLSNLLSLEKSYFQALNEQLKGNNVKAEELFKGLSQENPDLFFVKEAKKYLEENNRDTDEKDKKINYKILC